MALRQLFPTSSDESEPGAKRIKCCAPSSAQEAAASPAPHLGGGSGASALAASAPSLGGGGASARGSGASALAASAHHLGGGSGASAVVSSVAGMRRLFPTSSDESEPTAKRARGARSSGQEAAAPSASRASRLGGCSGVSTLAAPEATVIGRGSGVSVRGGSVASALASTESIIGGGSGSGASVPAASGGDDMHWSRFQKAHLQDEFNILGPQSKPLLMHTLFSGLGSPTQVLREFGVQVNEDMMAEMKDCARKFCGQNGLMPACYFDDVESLVKCGKGHCHVHGRSCKIPSARADILVAGFPCTAYSSQRPGARSQANVRTHKDFQKMSWTVEYILTNRPRTFLLENVPTFVGIRCGHKIAVSSDPGLVMPEYPYADMLPPLQRGGYELDYIVLPLDIWVEAKGSRAFIMGIDKSATRGSDDASVLVAKAKRMAANLHYSRARFPPCSWRESLMSMGGTEWMEFRAAVEMHDDSSMTHRASEHGDHEQVHANGMKWEAQAQKLRITWERQGKISQRGDVHQWTVAADGSSPCHIGISQPLAPRTVEMLDLAFLWSCIQRDAMEVTQSARQRAAQKLLVNYTQNPDRKPWGYVLGRFTRSCRWYSFEDDRLLSAHELFRIYGWRQVSLEGISYSDAVDMIGDSMALPTLGVALLAFTLACGRSIFACWDE